MPELTEFNPLHDEAAADLYRYYKRFRDTDPVHWDEGLASWICTDYASCNLVLRTPQVFTADPRRLGVELPDVLYTLQTLDPPEHTPLRHLMAAAFRGARIVDFAESFRATAAKHISGLAEGRVIDLTVDLLEPLALEAISQYLGVPTPDPTWFVEVSDRVVRGMDSGFFPDAQDGALRARRQLSDLAAEWMAAGSDSGLLGQLSRLNAPDAVSPEVLANTIRAVYHAGYASSCRFLENAMLAVLRHGDARAALAGDAAAVRRDALNELIRYDSPVQAVGRVCLDDFQLASRRVRRGDTVTLMLGAANHDPAVFGTPDSLVLDRRPNPHLAFGQGVHSCLGAGLALAEAEILISELLNAYPAVSLAGAPARRKSATLRGVATLPVLLSRDPGL